MDYQPLINRDYKSQLLDSGFAPRPRRHHYWLLLAAVPIVVTSFLTVAADKEAPVEPFVAPDAVVEHVALALPDKGHPAEKITLALPVPAAEKQTEQKVSEPEKVALLDAQPVPTPAADAIATAEEPAGTWRTAKVRSGDSMARIFDREGFSARDLHHIMKLGGVAKQLTRIHPGDELRFLAGGNGELLELRYKVDALNQVVVTNNGDSFEVGTETQTPERRLAHANGKIDSSLFMAAGKAGLSDNLTMELAGIFGWDVDFVLDIRQGDQFSLLYEKLYLNGESIGTGNILAAEFVNQGTTYKAVRYTDANGHTDYFTPEGKSMRKAFLRTPVSFSRISSKFSSGRKHPVLNKIRAHKGVDYAASRGTPIKATGSGKVVFAGKKGGYGKTVVLQHGTRYTTLYAHLNGYAKGIRSGKRVQQGQTIGFVGSTGLATGPHLHYEFRLDGVHRNPLTVKLPDAAPIQARFKDDFQAKAENLVAQLETLKQTTVALQQ